MRGNCRSAGFLGAIDAVIGRRVSAYGGQRRGAFRRSPSRFSLGRVGVGGGLGTSRGRVAYRVRGAKASSELRMANNEWDRLEADTTSARRFATPSSNPPVSRAGRCTGFPVAAGPFGSQDASAHCVGILFLGRLDTPVKWEPRRTQRIRRKEAWLGRLRHQNAKRERAPGGRGESRLRTPFDAVRSFGLLAGGSAARHPSVVT